LRASLTSSPRLIACPDCDLLQLPAEGSSGMTLCCRCRAVLERAAVLADLPLALAVTAAFALMLALAFPLVTLNVQPEAVSTTLPDTVRALWRADMPLLAVLVAATTLAVPALEILLVLNVSMHLHAGARPPLAAFSLRMLNAIEEWNMTEVFVLGALVALVKLGDFAQVEYGVALWSLAALMALLVGIGASFDARAAWHGLEAKR
jgi:paraquat-inducible protein A